MASEHRTIEEAALEIKRAFTTNRHVLDEKNRKIQDESLSSSGESDSMVHRILEAPPMLSDLPVYLDDDDKKLILSTLGQEQSEQDNLNLEKWNLSEWILKGEWHISRFERRLSPVQDESSSSSGESDSMVHRILEAPPMLSDLPVYLDDDDKKLILSTLGQEQSEQDNLILEKLNSSEGKLNGEWLIPRFKRRSSPIQDESSSSSGESEYEDEESMRQSKVQDESSSSVESESEDEESLRQSKILEKLNLSEGKLNGEWLIPRFKRRSSPDQQPVVPQPTNYKPKVVNDIRAQDHKGKGLFAFTELSDGIMTEFREVIKAEPVELGGLRDAFSTVASGSYWYHTTLITVLDLLTGPEVHGGAIFVIVDKEHKNDLEILISDNNCLYRFCRRNTAKVTNKLFQHLLCAFCTPGKSDQWEQSLLDKLATQFGKSSELKALKGQPMDGAFVLSHSGTVLAAAAKLEFHSQRYQLCKPNGMGFGTRHSGALATAEWMRSKNVKGVVFVRSVAGDVHVMFPHGKNWKSEPPKNPWLGEEGQKLPLILCIEDCKKEQSKGS